MLAGKDLKVPRRADEFRGVFEFFDKNCNGSLSFPELRYLMSGVGQEVPDDDIKEMISDIAGPGQKAVDVDHFLNFCAHQLQGDPVEELRESWRIASEQTKFEMDGETPKASQGINGKDVSLLMQKLGEDMTEEEAAEMVAQADKNDSGHISFDEFLNLMVVGIDAEQTKR